MPKTKVRDNIISLIPTPQELQIELAARVRALRLGRGWSQAVLAERAGIATVTLKSFERTGQITLSRLVLIARALDCLGGFDGLFKAPPAMTLSDLEDKPVRLRGRRGRSS